MLDETITLEKQKIMMLSVYPEEDIQYFKALQQESDIFSLESIVSFNIIKSEDGSNG